MTISSNNRKAGPFIGNGSAATFPFTFKVFQASDLFVVRLTVSTGAQSTLVLGTDYTVTLNLEQDSNPGGSITLVAGALASGYNLIITSDIGNLQPTDLTNQGGFYPEVINDSLDRATIQIQQLQEQTDRTLKYPVTDPSTGTELPAVAQRAGKVLTFDELGAPIAGPSVDEVGTILDNLANITTVANDLNGPDTIGTVATNIADVNAVGGSIADVNTVADNIADVGTVATNIADVIIAADNVADINNFADVYQGAKASDPTLRNNGSPLQPGDMYFNISVNELRLYSGSVWVAGTAGTVAVQRFSGTGSQTAFTLATAPSGENNTQVYINGVYQQKDTYGVTGVTLTFTTAPPGGTDNVEVVTISTLALGETDASLVSYLPSGAAAEQSTVQSKLRLFVNAEDFGAKGDGLTDDSTAIQTALNQAKYVLLTAGKTYVASALEAVANGSLMCVGGRATIKVPVGANYGMIIRKSNFVLDGINFDGGNLGPYNVASPTSGVRVGLYVGNSFGTNIQLQNISVQNSEIYGFDYAGLYGREVQIGFVFGHRATLHNVNCHHNYVNLWFSPRFEYVNATLCYGYEGYAGIIVQGGNNKVTSCSFENNWQNCQLATGENNSHGGFVNCSFNHAASGGLGLYAGAIEYGMSFTNCFFWYGPIELYGSTGVQIRNSQIVNSPIKVTSGGCNSIDDNYIRDPITPTFVGYTFTSFRRNRVAVSDTSFVPVYGDIYAQATASLWGAFPFTLGTAGTPLTMRPSFGTKKWHGVDASWMQSGNRLYIGTTRMIQVDSSLKINIGAADELITLTVARYNSSGTLVDSFPSSGAFKANQAGAVVSISTRMLCQAGDTVDILVTTINSVGGQAAAFDTRITSVD